MINISLINNTERVITARNKNMDKFYSRPKSDFEYELENKNSLTPNSSEGFEDENIIVKNIYNGYKYYTYNSIGNNFTPVLIDKNNIRTNKNKIIIDNLKELKIINF